MSRVVPILVLLSAGCGPELGDPLTTPMLDLDTYEAQVQPVVRFSCASLDCHGQARRPLRLYAQDGLRMRGDLRGEPLTPEEAAWNASAFAGIDPEPASIDEHIALLKPLAVEAGGMAHEGGDVWMSRDDPGYLCLAAWLAGSDDPTACATAREAVDPYP